MRLLTFFAQILKIALLLLSIYGQLIVYGMI